MKPLLQYIVRTLHNLSHFVSYLTSRSYSYQRLISKELDVAIAKNELYLVYQPKLCLRHGRYDGVEALLRWKHNSLGQIDCGSVIKLAEKTGQINNLTLWVMKRVVADQAYFQDHKLDFSFHINISGKSLCDDNFIDKILKIASNSTGIIGFEITETAFIANPKVALVNFNRIVASNICISIDDYGSGHSSLEYLKELPAKELKIDKLFISGMTSSNRDPLIVRSTIDLAHALGMQVVAEGVESQATLALLRVMGCDLAQGYFISQALRAEELEKFLLDQNHLRLLNSNSISLTPEKAFWGRIDGDHSVSTNG